MKLCRGHHRAVPDGGFTVERNGDGALAFYRPDERPLPEAPAAPPAPQNPVEALAAANARLDLGVDADTTTPDWHGERLDMDYAISVVWRPRSPGAPESAAQEAG